MNRKASPRYDLQAEIFKALTHPDRLRMLDLLRTKPWCVCELAAEIGVSKSVASKHLSQLKAAGIIEDVKQGTRVEYHLIAPCILEMAACAEKAIVALRRKALGD
jgi:ArsR family transcriptional regulator, arsenate/arsenite/antimonite-responsive transcriptional repressor